MKRIAKFHKVSREQFEQGWIDTFGETDGVWLEQTYEEIRLPRRATAGSAGYDFFSPADFTIHPGETLKIPTGVRVEIEPEWVLKCYPRSGLGFRYRLQLNNTVGIIDSDYFYSDNEGHIFAKLTNDTKEGKTLELTKGTGFMQGIFVEYGITVDDMVTETRNGGFGSTTAAQRNS
ncbi:MAG: deoxyuridine 5'-triphosphate nucleotidohydrolase [Hespellia sp.]|nr:deoxyuridine 5'-triphosphate nucleotidohydrolase [Hespellia sp.]